MPTAFAARGLEKRYGRSHALRGVDIEVGEGQVVGLLGPNGAGKSTLTKIACGLVRPTRGSVERPETVGYLAELFRFPGWCTADELLLLHQKLAGARTAASERAHLLELVGLDDARNVRVDAMSKGMQQRLGIAQALVGWPPLLLLDEPTSALDPLGRRVVRRLLDDVRGRGVAVLLNSHLLSEVELVCDRVTIIVGGKVVSEGAPHELARPRGVEIETGNGVKRFDGVTRDDVPRLVSELTAAGEAVYGVHLLASTLEDAYIDAVES